MPVFKGYASQYGAGLGNTLAGIARAAIPIVSPILKSLGKRILTSGAAKLESVLFPTAAQPAKKAPIQRPAVRRRTTRGGRGKKRRAIRRSTVGAGKRSKRDIFE